MKKKNYLIIGIIILAIINIISICNAQEIINETLKSMEGLQIQLDERILSIYSSKRIVIIPAVICILTNIISFIICITNNIGRKRNLLILLFATNFLFSNYFIGSIISIVLLIMCATLKKEQTETFKQVMPKLDRCDLGIKNILLGILFIGLYFSQNLLSFVKIPTLGLAILLSFFTNIVILVIGVLIFKVNLKRDLSYLKSHFRSYLSFIGPKLGIAYIVYVVSALVVSFISGSSSSVNQQTIEALPLYYTLPLAILLAPIIEELLFRGCLRRFIKNDTLFIIISAVTFGLLHTVHEANLFLVIIVSVPYAILGGFFAYIYTKTNNITTNIICHSFHNTVVMLLQILLFY